MTYNREKEYTVTFADGADYEDFQVYAASEERAVGKAKEKSSWSESRLDTAGVTISPINSPEQVTDVSQYIGPVRNEIQQSLGDSLTRQIRDESIQNVLEEYVHRVEEGAVQTYEYVQVAETVVTEYGSDIMAEHSTEIAEAIVTVLESSVL